jgi:agmatine/peptidylarginine deiminase
MKYQFLILLLISSLFGQAQNTPRFVAEWEPAWGTLIRWPLGIPSDLVIELASDDSLYVLVESYYQRDQAVASFDSWGVNTDHCRFLFAPTYSHWTRDWGPHYIINSLGIAGIADPIFDGYPWVPGCNTNKKIPADDYAKGYEEDDAVNIILADSFDCPLIDLPVYLTGGNVMVDGYKTAISTQQMLDENLPIGNEEYFKQIAYDSLGIENYIIVDNPEVYGIQHIDCYAKFLNERKIIVKQVDTWNPEYECCEALAEYLGSELNNWGEPYEIVRIYCGSYNGSEVAAYTNSLILNKKVLVPLFSIASDETALQTWAEAMPGYEITGFHYDQWYYYDALHCRVKGIFDRHMLRIEHRPVLGEQIFNGDPQFYFQITDHSHAGLVSDELLFHWRLSGTSTWYNEILTPMNDADSLFGFIPYPVIGDTYDYYISASDSSGRNGKLPITAPEDYFTFTITDIVQSSNSSIDPNKFSIAPSIFKDDVVISILHPDKHHTLSVYNMNGVKMREWKNIKENMMHWNGKDSQGNPVLPGIYFFKLESNKQLLIIKGIKTH